MILALAGTALVLAQAAPVQPAVDPELRARLPELVELMRAGIERAEPYLGIPNTARFETVFGGSYDYHSCVMAHWALLAVARVEDDAELDTWLLERLTPEALDLEIAALDALEGEPWTFPYEHAWLAMVLSELARREEVDADAVDACRGWVEAKLLDALEERPLPEEIPPRRAGGVGFCGFYKSWLMAYLLLQLSEPVSPDAAARMEALRLEKIEPQRAAILAHAERHGFDFLHVPALLALIDRTAPGGSRAELSPYPTAELEDLPDSVTLGTVHVLGVALSTVWPHGIDGAAGDREARARFQEQYERLLARGELWSDDFRVVSHWIPQYLWLGMWLAEGRP